MIATMLVDITYYSFERFLFRKISILIFSGLMQCCFALVIVPDTENTLSDGPMLLKYIKAVSSTLTGGTTFLGWLSTIPVH